jgi:hypothetical protein
LVVIGGVNTKKTRADCFIGQVGVLNLETMIWATIELFGRETVLKRAEHCTVINQEETMIYIFGGVDENFIL